MVGVVVHETGRVRVHKTIETKMFAWMHKTATKKSLWNLSPSIRKPVAPCLNSGYNYNQFTPAYPFGHEMRTDERFAGNEWSKVEPTARKEWETKNPGTWESFKGVVRHAWDSATK